MTKELNMEWINELLKDNNKEPNASNLPSIEVCHFPFVFRFLKSLKRI